MDPLTAALLGVLQGVTEFLPVSSSGHLVLARTSLGFPAPALAYDVAVHLATLAAIVWLLRADVAWVLGDTLRALGGRDGAPPSSRSGFRAGLLVTAACVPTAAVGLAFREELEGLSGRPDIVAGALMLNGIWLLLTGLRRERPRALEEMRLGDALLIGLAQAIAIAPGISRSGATIGVALLLGIRPRDAARFSFLLGIPAILGAAALEAPRLRAEALEGGWALLAGSAAALLSGLGALRLVLAVVEGRRFRLFGVYTLAAGLAALIVLGG